MGVKVHEPAETLIEALKRDGFATIPDFFGREMVERAHAELAEWFRKDLADREAKGVTAFAFEGVAGSSQLTRPSHLLLDVYGKSPTFDAMFERILTDPLSSKVLRALAGERIKMRGYNVRRMTGAYDPPPAHEWHRDSPGEFCIGIFLTDVPPEEHAATALVPGSHLFPYDPRPNCLFPGPYRGLRLFLRLNPFARRLAKVALRNASGAYGKRGDVYIFMNDVWHGRQPNLHGSESMVALLGAFPTEFPFPDKVKVPSPEVLARLPAAIREVVRQDQPPNPGRDTILHEALASQRKAQFPDAFYMARLERKVADVISAPVVFVTSWSLHGAKLLLLTLRRLAGMLPFARAVYQRTLKRWLA